MSSFLRLVFFLALLVMGGSTALVVYVILMFGVALLLPLLTSYHYYKADLEKMNGFVKCLVWLTLLGLGV